MEYVMQSNLSTADHRFTDNQMAKYGWRRIGPFWYGPNNKCAINRNLAEDAVAKAVAQEHRLVATNPNHGHSAYLRSVAAS